MAKKSKTQRAKASAARQQRKEQAALEESQGVTKAVEPKVEEAPKKSFFKKAEDPKPAKSEKNEKPKKNRFQFFKDVKAEMKRVTWPSRQDVIRWSGVVVASLLFFGIYVAILDNGIITPLLMVISGIGA